MKIVQVDKDEAAWDSFVETAERATGYHRFRWRSIIGESFGHDCYYFAAVDEAGVWRGVLPLVHMRSRLFGNFLVSMPFVNYGGLVCSDFRAARLLLDQAEYLRKSVQATYVELRHLGYSVEGFSSKEHKVTMILELAANEETQWKGFNAKLRNQIRKAQKSGLKFVIGQIELLDGFYEVFARNMRDLGTPVYAKNFFQRVLTSFPDCSRVLAVYYEKRMIAAGIALWFRDVLEIPWASSVGEYKALCPNNMLYWEAIKFAIKSGFKKFDFGRSTPNEGTFNFKKQWGALPVQLYWQYLLREGRTIPHLSPSNPKYRAAIRVWQNLPVPLTKFLGPLIVQNIP
jgi:FemAB-related protein (PEP-CTERM system-associated)